MSKKEFNIEHTDKIIDINELKEMQESNKEPEEEKVVVKKTRPVKKKVNGHKKNKKTKKNKAKKKKSGKKQSKITIILLWILTLIIGLLCIATVFALTHPFFNIQTINITGNAVNPRKTVESVLDFEEGSNIFLAKRKKTADNIMELPDVVEVQIKTVIPSTINIVIKEDFDLGYIEKDERYYVVDVNGNIKELANTDTENLIEIRGIDKNGIEEGSNISENAEVKNTLDEIKKTGLFNDIEYIDFTNLDSIDMKTKTGIEIKLGSYEKIDNKIPTLVKVLDEINNNKIDAKEILLNLGKNPIIVTNDGESNLPKDYEIEEENDNTNENEDKSA